MVFAARAFFVSSYRFHHEQEMQSLQRAALSVRELWTFFNPDIKTKFGQPKEERYEKKTR